VSISLQNHKTGKVMLAFVRQKNKIYKGKSALKKANPEPGAEP